MVAIADNNPGESYDQPTVGLILPPPEIRSMVEKTASFVARNGENFEQKIKQNEANNHKVRFEIILNTELCPILSSIFLKKKIRTTCTIARKLEILWSEPQP